MAKKIARKQKRARVTRAKKEVRMARKRGKAPFVLNIISVILLLLNGLVVIFGRKYLTEVLTQYGLESLISNLLTYGVIWLILGILIWISTLRIEKNESRAEKWYLLALGIISIFSLRWDSGILTIIGAVIYLSRK